MRRLPEKIGFVGRNHIDEVRPLVRASGGAVKVLTVCAERLQAQCPRALSQARFEHDPLAGGNNNSALRSDEIRQPAELAI
jgi:hypothetical protein